MMKNVATLFTVVFCDGVVGHRIIAILNTA